MGTPTKNNTTAKKKNIVAGGGLAYSPYADSKSSDYKLDGTNSIPVPQVKFEHQVLKDMPHPRVTETYHFDTVAAEISEIEKEEYAHCQKKRPDESIREEVLEALKVHTMVEADGIKVKVKEGDVYLTGTVPTREAKDLCAESVEKCFGIRDIFNQLQVSSDLQLMKSTNAH